MCDVVENILDYTVLEPDVNLSDHLPTVVRFKYTYPDSSPVTEPSPISDRQTDRHLFVQKHRITRAEAHLRWSIVNSKIE